MSPIQLTAVIGEIRDEPTRTGEEGIEDLRCREEHHTTSDLEGFRRRRFERYDEMTASIVHEMLEIS